jgi:hypothetical protein
MMKVSGLHIILLFLEIFTGHGLYTTEMPAALSPAKDKTHDTKEDNMYKNTGSDIKMIEKAAMLYPALARIVSSSYNEAMVQSDPIPSTDGQQKHDAGALSRFEADATADLANRAAQFGKELVKTATEAIDATTGAYAIDAKGRRPLMRHTTLN